MRNRLRSFLSHGKKRTDGEEVQKTQRPKNENVKCAAKWFEWACGALATRKYIFNHSKEEKSDAFVFKESGQFRRALRLGNEKKVKIKTGFWISPVARGCKLATMEQYA